MSRLNVSQKIFFTKSNGDKGHFWQKLGTAFTDDSGKVTAIELNANPIPQLQDDGSLKVRLNLFENDGNQQQQVQQQPQQQPVQQPYQQGYPR